MHVRLFFIYIVTRVLMYCIHTHVPHFRLDYTDSYISEYPHKNISNYRYIRDILTDILEKNINRPKIDQNSWKKKKKTL